MRLAFFANRVGIIPILFLSACGTTHTADPAVRTIETKVETPVSCVPADLAPAPSYPDDPASLKATDGPGRYDKLAAAYAMKSARLALLEGVVDQCRKAGPAPK